MDAMKRRVFLKGASMGVLTFTVGGIDILTTPGDARAPAVPFRLLNGEEAETLEAVGEALVPGAREAGIAHFSTSRSRFRPARRCSKHVSSTSDRLSQPFIGLPSAASTRRAPLAAASGLSFLRPWSSAISSISSARTRSMARPMRCRTSTSQARASSRLVVLQIRLTQSSPSRSALQRTWRQIGAPLRGERSVVRRKPRFRPNIGGPTAHRLSCHGKAGLLVSVGLRLTIGRAIAWWPHQIQEADMRSALR
jgi:hypothetical protein